MIIITASELEKNLDKYIELGQKETIKVTQNDKTIFNIVPEKEKLKTEWKNLFGSLPKEVYDCDIERE